MHDDLKDFIQSLSIAKQHLFFEVIEDVLADEINRIYDLENEEDIEE